MKRSPGAGPTPLELEEMFAREDPAFLESVRRFQGGKILGGLADRWKKDGRPWARSQLLAYLERPLDRPQHLPVVKRTFKHAEATGDAELMGAFAVAFDRLVRRVPRTRFRFDTRTRTVHELRVLVLPMKTITQRDERRALDPWSGKQITVPIRYGPDHRLFTHRTRYYLRRRAWRWFRRLGYRRPDLYVDRVAAFVGRYRDADLASGPNIIDSWILMNALFHGSDVIRITPSRVRLVPGRRLEELEASPRFEDLWARESALSPLLGLIFEARSRFVRLQAAALIRRHHAERLASLDADLVRRLLESGDEDVVDLAIQMLEASSRLPTQPLDFWLALTAVGNPRVLEVVCDLFRRHVAQDRVDNPTALALARSSSVPVSRLGLELLADRTFDTKSDLQELVGLAEAACPATAAETTRLALRHLARPEVYDVDRVIDFLDSPLSEVRTTAWESLARSTPETGPNPSPSREDPEFFRRVLETPYDDLRFAVIRELRDRSRLPGTDASDLAPIWASVLLNVHRGNRVKRQALARLEEAIRERPDLGEPLIPLLALPLRSSRLPERKASLKHLVSLLQARPELAPMIHAAAPGLKVEELPA